MFHKFVRKIDAINKEFKPLGHTCQKKVRDEFWVRNLSQEKEYRDAQVQLLTKLTELVSESEKTRMKKLEELSKNIESLK